MKITRVEAFQVQWSADDEAIPAQRFRAGAHR